MRFLLRVALLVPPFADKVLFDWAVQQAREANAIQRVTRGNPHPADVVGRGTDQFGD